MVGVRAAPMIDNFKAVPTDREAMRGLLAMLRRRYTWAILTVLASALCMGMVVAAGPFNEFEAKGFKSELDKEKVWVLDFRFKAPRLIKVNIPGRGTRICWYLWYQVINNSKPREPHTFIPDFELVTQDTDNPGIYHDEVLPKVQEAINKIENPTNADYLTAKNSVTISNTPIPPSKDDAFPIAVTGVAIWDGTTADPKKRDGKKKDLADSNRFSIFVSGLSNGWVLTDPPAGKPDELPVVRRKTLRLDFKRRGDRFLLDSRDISFQPPAEWIYRASTLTLPKEDAKAEANKKEE
jgi:hypothetical protein